MREAWEAGRVIGNIAGAVERARGTGVPVARVQHADDELVRGTPEWALVPGLQPADGAVVIHKGFNSAFEKTALQEELTRLGVGRIVLAGAATDLGIREEIQQKGYSVSLLDVALKYQFSNPGRFARMYKQTFGVLPSQARRRR